MITLERYYYEDHWALLWRAYNDKAYSDFFRRAPVALNKKQVAQDFEDITHSRIFIIKHNEFSIGIASISQECPFTLSCYIGIMIFEEHQRQGFLVNTIDEVCNYIYEYSNLNKIKVRVMKQNVALNNVIRKYGLRLEGEYINEIKNKDEFEYCVTRDIHKQYKEQKHVS